MCWPSSGGVRRMVTGVSDRFSGLRSIGTSPAVGCVTGSTRRHPDPVLRAEALIVFRSVSPTCQRSLAKDGSWPTAGIAGRQVRSGSVRSTFGRHCDHEVEVVSVSIQIRLPGSSRSWAPAVGRDTSPRDTPESGQPKDPRVDQLLVDNAAVAVWTRAADSATERGASSHRLISAAKSPTFASQPSI